MVVVLVVWYSPVSLVKTSNGRLVVDEYVSTTSLTASARYRLKQPGQHITEPITFWALLIIQKSEKKINI